MKVIKTIRPGQKGSRRFVQQWGKQLLAVRYRQVSSDSEVLTTLEIIVDRRPLINEGRRQNAYLASRNHSMVAVQIRYSEKELRTRIIEQGGRWYHARRLWFLTYDKAVLLGLVDRIVPLTDICPNSGEVANHKSL